MKKKPITPKKAAKLSPAMASKIRTKAKSMLGRDYVKADPDSAAGAAT